MKKHSWDISTWMSYEASCVKCGIDIALSEEELTAFKEEAKAKVEKVRPNWECRYLEDVTKGLARKFLEEKTIPFDKEGCIGPDKIPICDCCNGVDTMKALTQNLEKGTIYWMCGRCWRTEHYPIPGPQNEIKEKIREFLDSYAPNPHLPFIRIDYDRWTDHVYNELKGRPRKNDDELRSILLNILCTLTNETVIQDSGVEEAMEPFREIYDMFNTGWDFKFFKGASEKASTKPRVALFSDDADSAIADACEKLM